MATVKKTKAGYTVQRKVGKDNKDCPRINLIRDMGIVIGSTYSVTQSVDAKTITLRLVENE